MSLAEVYEAYREDPAFAHLRTQGIVLVPGEGASRPNVFIVGEAPGAVENTLQRPFSGASGTVLRSLISDCAGLAPAEYFITNVVKYRPPGNRTPEFEEVDASRPHLRNEYAALGSPRVIIAVGGTAKEALAPELPDAVIKSAGQAIERPGGRTMWVMIHPSFGLRQVRFRPTMEEHWTAFGEWYRKESW